MMKKRLLWIVGGLFIVALVGLMLATAYKVFFSDSERYQNRINIILDGIQPLSVLTSIRYNYSNLVTSEREMPGILAALYGERLVLVAVGHVTAGVDLSQLSRDDITTQGNSMVIRLPPPQLQDCFLNESASYVVARDTGIFSRGAPELDAAARRFAIQQFRDAALEQGILEEASTQAGTAIGAFIELLGLEGIETVSIDTADPATDALFPDTCL